MTPVLGVRRCEEQLLYAELYFGTPWQPATCIASCRRHVWGFVELNRSKVAVVRQMVRARMAEVLW